MLCFALPCSQQANKGLGVDAGTHAGSATDQEGQELEQTSSGCLAAQAPEEAGPAGLSLCAGACLPTLGTPSGPAAAGAGWAAALHSAGQCWPWLAAGAGCRLVFLKRLMLDWPVEEAKVVCISQPVVM